MNFHTSNFEFLFCHQSFFLPYFVSAPRLVLPSRTGRVTGCDLRNHIIAPLCRCRPRLSHIAGTPPQSSGGREEVSFTPMKIIAYLLRLAGSCAAWIAPAFAIVAPPHARSPPWVNVPVTRSVLFSRFVSAKSTCLKFDFSSDHPSNLLMV